MSALDERLATTLRTLKDEGTHKVFRSITAPMDAVTEIGGHGQVLVFCSNNYLGLCDNPDVMKAVKDGTDRYGAGTSSVRFICGTFDIHRELESRIADFLELMPNACRLHERLQERWRFQHFDFGKPFPEVVQEGLH